MTTHAQALARIEEETKNLDLRIEAHKRFAHNDSECAAGMELKPIIDMQIAECESALSSWLTNKAVLELPTAKRPQSVHATEWDFGVANGYNIALQDVADLIIKGVMG